MVRLSVTTCAFLLAWATSPCFSFPSLISKPRHLGEAHRQVARAASQDPSCPAGFLCVQQACPDDVICGSGEQCINFEGTIGCVPTGSSWCALNPSNFQGVGCYKGRCCHGQCYADNAICCNNANIQCQLGTACNVCEPQQTCASNGCIGSPSSTLTTTSNTITKPAATTTQKTTTVLGGTTIGGTTVVGGTTIVGVTTIVGSTTIFAGTTIVGGTTIGGGTTTKTGTIPVTTGKTSTGGSSGATPTSVPSIGDGYQNIGCYVDSTDSRVLQGGSSTASGSTLGMTVEKCGDVALGWKYAGLEFSEECWFGDSLGQTQQVDIQQCDMACAGNPNELCGGGNRILIYQDVLWAIPTTLSFANEDLQTLSDALVELRELIVKWRAAVDAYRTFLLSGGQNRRRQGSSQQQQVDNIHEIGREVDNQNSQVKKQLSAVTRRARTGVIHNIFPQPQLHQVDETVNAGDQLEMEMQLLGFPEAGVGVGIDPALLALTSETAGDAIAAIGTVEIIGGVVVSGTAALGIIGVFIEDLIGLPLPGNSGGGGTTTMATSTTATTSSTKTTSSSTQTPSTWIVVPVDGAPILTESSFTKELQADLGELNVKPIIRPDNHVSIWIAQMTPDQVSKYKKEVSIVDSIVADEPIARVLTDGRSRPQKRSVDEDDTVKKLRRDGSNNPVHNAPQEICVISQPPGGPNPAGFGTYWRKEDAGVGTYIYILDVLNVEDQHPELIPGGPILPLPERRSLWAGEGQALGTAINGQAYVIDKQTKLEHITGMAAKAVGNTLGVANRANLISVVLPPFIDPVPSTVFDGLEKIMNDVDTIRTQDGLRRSRFVVAMAMEWSTSQPLQGRIEDQIRMMSEMGDVVFVMATGNCRVPSGPNDFDCLANAPNTADDPVDPITRLAADPTLAIIGVGSVNTMGVRSAFSQGSLNGGVLAISAVGEDVTIPDINNLNGLDVLNDGTSFAAPQVAGLIAYWLSLPSLENRWNTQGSVSRNVKDYLQSQDGSQIRDLNGPGFRVAWNGNSMP